MRQTTTPTSTSPGQTTSLLFVRTIHRSLSYLTATAGFPGHDGNNQKVINETSLVLFPLIATNNVLVEICKVGRDTPPFRVSTTDRTCLSISKILVYNDALLLRRFLSFGMLS